MNETPDFYAYWASCGGEPYTIIRRRKSDEQRTACRCCGRYIDDCDDGEYCDLCRAIIERVRGRRGTNL